MPWFLSSVWVLMAWISCCARSGSDPMRDKPAFADVAALGRKLGVQLPADTEVLGVTTESGGPDDAVFAKLRFSKDQLDEFLKRTGAIRFRAGGADVLGPDRGFWDPHRAKSLRVARVQQPSSRGLILGIDQSEAKVVVIYALNHGM